jgi:hypothetical protein
MCEMLQNDLGRVATLLNDRSTSTFLCGGKKHIGQCAHRVVIYITLSMFISAAMVSREGRSLAAP